MVRVVRGGLVRAARIRRKGDQTGVRTASEGRPEASCGPVRAVSEGVRQVSEDVQKIYGIRTKSDKTVRDWMESFPEIQESERGRPFKRALMAGGVVMTLVSTYSRFPPRVTIVFATAAAAALVGFDFCHMFGRILADYSRWCLAAGLLAWTLAAVRPSQVSLAVAGGTSVTILLIVAKCNLKWLSAQVYQRCPTVKKAMAKVIPAEVENLWQLTGSRMVRSLAWELGLPVDDGNDMKRKFLEGCWLIGFVTGNKFSQQAVKDNARLATENTELQEQVAELQEALDEAADFVEDREDYMAELAGVKEELQATAAQLIAAQRDAREAYARTVDQGETIELMKCEISQKDETISTLETQLADAMARAAEPVETVEVEMMPITALESNKARVTRLLGEAYEAGMSVREAAKHAGCSKFKAEQFWKSQKQDFESGAAEPATAVASG